MLINSRHIKPPTLFSAIIIVNIIIGALLYVCLIHPQLEILSSKKTMELKLKREFSLKTKVLIRQQAALQDTKMMKQLLNKQLTELQKMQIDKMLTIIIHLMATHHLQLESIDPRATNHTISILGTPVKCDHVSLIINGNYPQIINFLIDLFKLKYLLKITQFNLFHNMAQLSLILKFEVYHF